VLQVADDGPGGSIEPLEAQSPGSGQRIIRALVRSLGGEISVEVDNGRKVTVEIPTLQER
jgi:two-component sensor histidine kinase